jgi:iron complex outermembrane recepter protein
MTRSRIRKIARVRSTPHTRLMAAAVPLASAISAILGSTSPVFAQESAELGQIIVTAQKREENLQNVPLSIQAIGSEQIEQLHLTDFADYASFLPSLSYQSGGQSGGSGFARPYMRGVASGGDGNHSASPPSVGMYLDEQPITTISGALDIHMYDIARVEALAGPQGTLYGASSEAGTVRIITNKPDPTGFQAGYDLEGNSVDHGGTGYTVEGFANIPISDSAAVRLVGWYEDNPGFIDNVHGTLTYPTSGATIDNANQVKKDYNDGENYGARAALKLDLGENWTVTPSVMGQWSKSNGSYGYRVGEPFEITRFNPEDAKDEWWQAALTVEGRIGNFNLVYAGSYLNRDDWTKSDYVDYSFYYDECCGYGVYVMDDAGNFIDPTQYIWGKDKYKMQSHELRISSPQDQRFRFVGGLFYARNQHDIEQRYLISNLAGPTAIPPQPSLEVTGWPDTWWLTEQVRVDKDYAAFGEVTFDITEKLSATGGVRFYKYENSLEGFFGFGLTNDFTSATGEKSCFSTTQVNGGPCMNLDKDVDDTGNILKGNLTYRFTDQALVYATYSEGFRPGGVNRVGTTLPYKADELKNYEVGWKTTWAGNRLRFNGAIFQEDWKDFQFAFLGPNSVTIVANAGKAQMTGVETELSWLATAGLTLSLGAAYIDAKLTHPYCGTLDANGNDADPCVDGDGVPAPFQAPDGQQLPVTPKFKGNLIARYTFDVGSYNAHVQGAVAYVDKRWPELRTEQRDILGREPAYTVANFAGGIANQNFSIELFINNAFDEEGQVDRWAQCDATVCGTQGTYITPVPTRTYGIKFGQQF